MPILSGFAWGGEQNSSSGSGDTPIVGEIYNFEYTGSVQTKTFPAGTYKLECWGAQGGYRSAAIKGGYGGYSVGTLELSETATFYIYVGGAGGSGNTLISGDVTGGFNGGGYRYGYPGGGGASDIRIGQDSLYARVIVAGGGGSDGATGKTGMYGGGETGGSSSENYASYSSYAGKGGTQTYSGYSSTYTATAQKTSGLSLTTLPSEVTEQVAYYGGGFGFGGAGVSYASGTNTKGYGGAGGGGWYGGAGTIADTSNDDDRGGGGGSGYVYTAETAANYPAECLLSTSHYLTEASTMAGNTSFVDPDGTTVIGHQNNGYVRITYETAE